MDQDQQDWLLYFMTFDQPALTDTPGRGPLSRKDQELKRLNKRLEPPVSERAKQQMIDSLMGKDPTAAIEFIHRNLDLELNSLISKQREQRKQKLGM